jgi:hypothetical protein
VKPLPDRAAFEQNLQVQDAVVRNIEIIGEAASQINRMAPEFIAQHPDLPWDDMGLSAISPFPKITLPLVGTPECYAGESPVYRLHVRP